ncbi:MAG: hypothetical protein GC134_05545 [Proteobacteria bacterium]|nr:hypothetical protein [Pseudomonadota bacterium]
MSEKDTPPKHARIQGFRIKVEIGSIDRFLFWKSFTTYWTGQAFAIDTHRLVTCAHVVGRGKPVNVRFPNNLDLPAIARILTFPESGPYGDIAIIEFTAPHGLPVVTQAAANPAVGDKVMFDNKYGAFKEGVVHFYGDRGTIWRTLINAGIVNPNALPDTLENRLKDADDAALTDLYTDMPVRDGDSGSPVFNEQGELVGMAYATSKLTYQSMVMPIEQMKAYIAQLLEQ